jgi:voltage-gated potassium channel Kch
MQGSNPILDFISPRKIFTILISVLAIGTVFYHLVEKLSWLDSIYFCVVTLTTVGYGDITPHTTAGKILTIFYILIGVGIIASTVSYLLRYVATQQLPAETIKKRLDLSGSNNEPKNNQKQHK